MGNDAGQGHVQGIANVDDGLLIEQNRLDKVIRQLSMRTPMTASTYAGWQRWATSVNFLIVGLLAIDPAFLSVGIFHIPTPSHTRDSALAGLEHRDLGSKGILVLIVATIVFGIKPGRSHCRDFGEASTRDGDIVSGRVSGIPHRRNSLAPTIDINLTILRIESANPLGSKIMPIFSF